MSKKEVVFLIDEELNKKFVKITKDKNSRNEIINSFIKNYVMDNNDKLNIDNILDKVAKYGTNSLTNEEMEFLAKLN